MQNWIEPELSLDSLRFPAAEIMDRAPKVLSELADWTSLG